MSLRKPTYLQIIKSNFPDVKCWADGDGSIYEAIYAQADSDPLPAKSVLDAMILASVKAAVWVLIKAKRTQVQAGGVRVASVDKWFDSDPNSRTQQLGLVIMGSNMPAGVQWKTMGGEYVTMTPTLAQQIFLAVAALDMQAFANSQAHKAALQASSEPENYDFSTGWPQEYQP